MVVRSEEGAKNVVLIGKKDISKVENTLLQWILQINLRKLDVSENIKVYYDRFLRNGLHERPCYISKSR